MVIHRTASAILSAVMLTAGLGLGTCHAQDTGSAVRIPAPPQKWTASGQEAPYHTGTRDGDGALRLKRATDADDPRWSSDLFDLKPGEYELTAHLKTRDMYSPDNSFNAHLDVILYTADKRRIATRTLVYALGQTEDWYTSSGRFSAPQNARKARFEFAFQKATGSAWITNMELQKLAGRPRKSRITFPKNGFDPHSARQHNIFYPGDAIWFKTWCKVPDGTSVTCRLTDYAHRRVKEVPVELHPSAVGAFLVTRPLQDGLQTGKFYLAHLDFRRGDTLLYSNYEPFVILPEPVFPDNDPRQSHFGTIVGNTQDDVLLLHRIGCGWVRCPNMGRSVDTIYTADSLGMGVIAGLSVPGPYRPDLKKEEKRGFGRIKYAFTDRDGVKQALMEHIRNYRAWVDIWQIGNEPGHQPHQIENYARFHEVASEAIREAAPDADIMMGGLTGLGWEGPPALQDQWSPNPVVAYIDRFNLHERADYYDYHFYQPWSAVARILPQTVDDYRSRNAELPLWCTEANNRCFDEYQPKRASDLIKRIAVLRAGGVDTILWFLIQDPRKRGFGLISPGGTPQPSYVSFYHVVRVLTGSTFVQRHELDDLSWVYEFEKDGRQVYLCWREGPDEGELSPPGGKAAIRTQRDWQEYLSRTGTGQVTLPALGAAATITRFDGSRTSRAVEGNEITITLRANASIVEIGD